VLDRLALAAPAVVKARTPAGRVARVPVLQM
jgi:hypothetical protein